MNWKKAIFGCYEGYCARGGGKWYDMRKPVDALSWRTRQFMRETPKLVRWRLADRLARTVCWIRGERWYVADTWHGIPGNRAAELRQQIWENCVLLWTQERDEDKDRLTDIDHSLTELAQLANESCGLVWPKEKQNYERKTITPRPESHSQTS